MMTVDLSLITSGSVRKPPRVVIYGTSGIGKTKFACGAPDPFIIDADKGSYAFNAKRVIPTSWSDVKAWVNAVDEGQLKCKTLVLDSVTAMEGMSHAELIPGVYSDNGYRGDIVAFMAWRELVFQLESIWNKGIGVVFVGHIAVKQFNDPAGSSFDRFELACRPKIAGLLTQWSDYVLMAREELTTQKIDRRNKATTTGVRWAYTKRCPAFDAKARSESSFPEQILLGWDHFEEAIKQSDEDETTKKQIEEALQEIADSIYTDKVQGFVKDNPKKLDEVCNKVFARLVEVRKVREADQ